ncbi:MAG: hypothetical protein R3C11_20065 [Planctomycetaceae bacterium]
MFTGTWSFGEEVIPVDIISTSEKAFIKSYIPQIEAYVNSLSETWKSFLKSVSPKVIREVKEMELVEETTRLKQSSVKVVNLQILLIEDEEEKLWFTFGFTLTGVLPKGQSIEYTNNFDRNKEHIEFVSLG